MNSSIKTAAFAGITVGILDGIAAVVSAALRGISPDRVFQYISSGLLGRGAFEGGWSTVALGVLLHFVVAFGAAAVFVAAAARFAFLKSKPLLVGPLYGIAVFFFMGEVVSALSNVSRQPRTLSGIAVGMLIHIFFVGLPIALITSKTSTKDVFHT